MKKRYLTIIVSMLMVYVASLLLLVYVESFSPDATILNIKDALWYSLVTLTTVGYGDFFPVTALGKTIGAVFLLLSTSLLAIIVALFMTFSQLIARVRLNLNKNKVWYIFSSTSPKAIQLAKGIYDEDKKAIIVFSIDGQEDKASLSELKNIGAILIKSTIEEISALNNNSENCHLFFMSDDEYKNYQDALNIKTDNSKVYCLSDYQFEQNSRHISFFSRQEICARLYWQQKPLERNAENVVIIGSGKFANALLEQALLVNVFSPDQQIKYYLFSDNNAFLQLHPRLSQVVSLNELALSKDCIMVYNDWKQKTEIIQRADRIILWSDNDEENLENYSTITRYFPVENAIHIRLSTQVPSVQCFGSDRQLYTPALVMHSSLDGIAQAMHNIYLSSTGAVSPAWEQLSAFTYRSNISAADHLLTKIRILLDDDNSTDINKDICNKAYNIYLETKPVKADLYRNIEHIRWMRFHALHNWEYSPERDNSRRKHPSMVSFDKLKKADQEKDDYSWQLIEIIADYLKN